MFHAAQGSTVNPQVAKLREMYKKALAQATVAQAQKDVQNKNTPNATPEKQ
jgi:hypothetical protein